MGNKSLNISLLPLDKMAVPVGPGVMGAVNRSVSFKPGGPGPPYTPVKCEHVAETASSEGEQVWWLLLVSQARKLFQCQTQ